MKRTCVLILLALAMMTGNNCYAVMLFGGASHADYLPPVSQEQAPLIRPLQSENPAADWRSGPTRITPSKIIWFEIPKWMAGQWTKRGDLTVQVTDPRTGYTSDTNEWTDDDMTVTFGHLLDKEGNIWHAYMIPSERDGHNSGTLVRFITIDFQPLQQDPSRAIGRSRYLIAQSSNPYSSNYQLQEESLNEYSPINETEIQNYSSNRIYGYDGRPVRQGLLLSKFKRDKPFVPVTQENGIELMPLFREFLTNNGMQSLVPE